ncbi:extracellular solute-binding protein [Paenibacillus cymbidii]|uniref:extracellular solute-binding protein n=1 Tax=Paenibacillus cymbidii TaxID=1639034 RepID=UPI0010821A55|nr:extracellular solute-binding protein [Paenibacillus cymbidii]
MSRKPSRSTFRDKLDYMIQSLRNDMIQGHYRAGDFLPSEEVLVERFKLSNKSVRSGLDQLVAEGLIVKVHRVGSKVTEKAGQTYQHISLGYFPSIPRDLALKELLDVFQTLYPAIRVKTFALPASPSVEMMEGYLKQGMLDVITLNNATFQLLDESGAVSMLDEIHEPTGAYPFLSATFSRQGKLYAHPVSFTPVVLLYNKAHFREAGVPEPDSSWRWSDAVSQATALTTGAGRHGLCFHPISENRWPVFFLQSGVAFARQRDGTYAFDREKLIRAVRQCMAIIRNQQAFSHYMSENNDDTTRLFAEGKVSMILATYFAMNDLKETALEYDISPLPFIEQPGTLAVMFGVAVNRASKVKEAAHKLAAFFGSEEAQRIVAAATVSIPSMKTVAESIVSSPADPINRPSRYAMFREILPTLKTQEDLRLPVQALETVRQLLKQYWSGILDEERFCDRLAEELHSMPLAK